MYKWDSTILDIVANVECIVLFVFHLYFIKLSSVHFTAISSYYIGVVTEDEQQSTSH